MTRNKGTAVAAAVILCICLAGTMVESQPISMPHVIFGTVSDVQGNHIQNAHVTVKNLRTDQYLTDSTNSEGNYQIDLAVMPGGYQAGDELEVSAESGDLFASRTIMASTGPNDQCNLVLEESGTPFLGTAAIISLAAFIGIVISLFRRRITS